MPGFYYKTFTADVCTMTLACMSCAPGAVSRCFRTWDGPSMDGRAGARLIWETVWRCEDECRSRMTSARTAGRVQVKHVGSRSLVARSRAQ
jgi:hypothetical protein